MKTTKPITALMLAALVACGGGAESADSAETGGATAESGIAVMPTAQGTLPAAVLGNHGELQGTDVSYYDADPAAVGYFASPSGDGPYPSLLIIHEWNGLVDRVREVADAFAAEGYATLAVDLYYGQTGSNPEENVALIQEANSDMEKLIGNLNAGAAFLRSQPNASGTVGAMGWCFGGGIALTYGLEGDDHEATAIFYGALSDDPDVVANLTHEVYGSFGADDARPSPEAVAAFEQALDAAGIDHDLHVYDGVGHAFWLRVEDNAEARTAPATDAWDRLRAYLSRTLGG